MTDFDSSDVEWDNKSIAPSKNASWGYNPDEASIVAMLADAESDHLKSKKTVKALEFGHGSPGTMRIQALWVNRFNAFREHTLKHSLEKPFTGDDILRFFDVIIDKIKPTFLDKPAVSKITIGHALKVLSQYGTFWYGSAASEYCLTAQDGIRIQTWIDNAVKAGCLVWGRWKKTPRFIQLEYYAGQIAFNLTDAYCLQYWHIDLVLDNNNSIDATTVVKPPQWMDIRACICFEFTKGHKDTQNQDFTLYLRPVTNMEYVHVWPLALLMIHALRHGLVEGTTLDQILEQTALAADQKVKWLFSSRPVLTAFLATPSQKDCFEVKLDKPARIGQLQRNLQEIGLVANLLVPTTLHALRHEAAADVAHLPAARNGMGIAIPEVRQFLNHSNRSFANGVTEQYTGDVTRKFWNDRVKNPYQSVWAPRFSNTSAVDVVSKPVLAQEIANWQIAHEVPIADRNLESAQNLARRRIRQERHEHFMATAIPEKRKQNKAGSAGSKVMVKSFAQNSKSCLDTDSSDTDSNDIESMDGTNVIDDDSMLDILNMDDDKLNSLEDQVFSIVFDDSASAAAAAAVAVETTTSPDLVSNSLGESDKELDISSVLAESEALFNHNILESTKHDRQQDQSPQGFITLYAAINIVCRDRFAKLWPHFSSQTVSFEDHGISQFARRGNSLDEPSLMVFCCKKTRGCLYTTVRKSSLICHETVCTAGLIAPAVKKTETVATISCHEKNCHQKFRTPDQFKGHHLNGATPPEFTELAKPTRSMFVFTIPAAFRWRVGIQVVRKQYPSFTKPGRSTISTSR
ncbi:hypothetical protein MMC22_000029 [Lobaria immixta]|nr:hypothetical protein [Lobaria immixta]